MHSARPEDAISGHSRGGPTPDALEPAESSPSRSARISDRTRSQPIDQRMSCCKRKPSTPATAMTIPHRSSATQRFRSCGIAHEAVRARNSPVASAILLRGRGPEGKETMMSENLCQKLVSDEFGRAVERVYREWDRAWSEDDLDAMIALYVPDAVLESPLVAYLLGNKTGGEPRSRRCSRGQPRGSLAGGPSTARAISLMAGCWCGSIPGPHPRASKWTSSR
ncbi:hypothetical protein E9232_002080 [Inquilinus ginsengisoli]|uniref:Nuclear transport factor 2 family protein n=1 Tax=Inquilinus ginsengisoli TaxID=363840 RepID=A0ABU1JLU8_9PROT|nr:hypothetical protein [Inquilinus ginsengisoli]